MSENIDTQKLNSLEKFISNISKDDSEGELINVLREAQEIFGYLPQEVQLFISRKMEIPASKVFGVASFYSFFTMEPRGKHIINVCLGTACFVKGAEKIIDELRKKLNIKNGTTSDDGMYTVDTVRCIGACGLAPVLLVDDKVYGRVTSEDIDKIIKELNTNKPDVEIPLVQS